MVSEKIHFGWKIEATEISKLHVSYSITLSEGEECKLIEMKEGMLTGICTVNFPKNNQNTESRNM